MEDKDKKTTVESSKVESPKPQPTPKEEPKKVRREKPPTEPIYKLNFRLPNGQVRPDLPKELVRRAAMEFGDLLQAIPHYKWVTMEEIVQQVWEKEARAARKIWNRGRSGIERGVKELVEMGCVLTDSGA